MSSADGLADTGHPRAGAPTRSFPIPWPLLTAAIVLLVWWLLTAAGLFSPLVLPGPALVLRSFVRVTTEQYAGATLLGHALASALRLLSAFVVTVCVGIPLGLAMGSSRLVREIVNPWLEFYRPVPSLAYIGLLVIWLGVGEFSRVTLLVLGGLPAVIIGTCQAVGRVRSDRIEGARSLGIGGAALFRVVILPSCLPEILTAVRIASTGIFTTLLAAEMMGSRIGLGAMLSAASNQMQPGVVYVVIIAIGMMGLAVDKLLRLLQRRLVPWAGQF